MKKKQQKREKKCPQTCMYYYNRKSAEWGCFDCFAGKKVESK